MHWAGSSKVQCASDHYGPTVGRVTCATNWASSVFERRTVDKYLAVSKAVAKQCNLVDGTIPYEVLPTFISDGIGTLSSSPDARVQELPPNGYLLFVGDITGGKGVDVLLKAYAQLVDAPPLVLIGRRCADTPRELPADVSLFESWPHDAVMHAWSKCLFGVAPSVFPEACGTIVMEANAVGKTMVASKIGGLSDLIDAGKTGLLVPPNDADALANAMQYLIKNPEQREAMAAASRKYVERFMAKSIRAPDRTRLSGDFCRSRAARSRNFRSNVGARAGLVKAAASHVSRTPIRTTSAPLDRPRDSPTRGPVSTLPVG